MDEKARLEQVFDNWYYDGYSVTNIRESLSHTYNTDMLNDYLKWTKVFAALNNLNHKDLPHFKIFDAGCGNGNSLRKLIEYGADPKNCYGMDVSEKVLEYAREISPAAVHYEQGYIDNTQLESESIDLAICFGVLIHILDNDYIRKIGDEFKRILKKGGILFVIVTYEGAGWQESIQSTTRNFNFAQNELQELFSKLTCLGVIDCYSDNYPKDVSHGTIISAFEQNAINNVPFKLLVFKA